MTEVIERKLNKYLFPVEERRIFYDTPNSSYKGTNEYKAIVRTDKNKLVSVMQDSYKLIPNREVIMPLIEQLNSLDTKWNFDNSHSFVDSKRMRLQVTFPDLTMNDGRSDIALSLFVHNSYDGSEGVRMYWGAIRAICSNGMVFGEVLAKFYSKHTSGINLGNLGQQIENTYSQVPVIKERIEVLKNIEVTDSLKKEVEKKMGKTLSKYLDNQMPPQNQWVLYNMITFYVSHIVAQRMRAAYQMKTSQIFKL